MPTSPTSTNTVRNDFTTNIISGGSGNDHLIHHRDPSFQTSASTGLSGFGGDDILEASLSNMGQAHMFGGTGDDWIILDVTKDPGARGHQGHHAYGGHGQDTFQFTNIAENEAPIVGRIDDFNPTEDVIMVEDTIIDLEDLPRSIRLSNGEMIEVRVVEIEPPEFEDEDLGPQYFLSIGDDIFYAIDGARLLDNGKSGRTGEERHFVDRATLDVLRSAPTVQYENPRNFVPHEFYEDREDDLNLNNTPAGAVVTADVGEKSAVHMFGGKSALNEHKDHDSAGHEGHGHDSHDGDHDDGHDHCDCGEDCLGDCQDKDDGAPVGDSDAVGHETSGSQTMQGSAGDDVIDANTGNDLVRGFDGNDLIAGGIDNDIVYGGTGDDMLWGGDGDDRLFGGQGDDYIEGGRGDDYVNGGLGGDTLVGGLGNDTLVGGGGDDVVNRFHFHDEDGQDEIADFKPGVDLITFQDDVDPLTIEIFENQAGNVVINYGQAGTVTLRDVSLEDFQEAATIRADEDNPIITITPDPEEEILREQRIASGYYGAEDPPTLKDEGILYGADAFSENSPGGYAYVRDEPEPDEPEDPDSGPIIPDDGAPPLPPIPVPEHDEEDEDDSFETYFPTCFVATAAYRDPWHPDVVFLRAFRDKWLVHRAWGRAFIAFYWRIGPLLAIFVMRGHRRALVSKAFISLIVRILVAFMGQHLSERRRDSGDVAKDELSCPSNPRRSLDRTPFRRLDILMDAESGPRGGHL